MMGPCPCSQGLVSLQNGLLPASGEGVKKRVCAWWRGPQGPQVESILAKEPLAWSQAAQRESGRE